MARRFLAAFYGPAQVEKVQVITQDQQGERYRTIGKTVLVPGWYEVIPQTGGEGRKGKKGAGDEDQDAAIPPLQAGQSVVLNKAEAREGKTKPPQRYTEASLLGIMESAGKLVEDEDLRAAMKSAGLGTPATRAAIIERLITVGYVTRDGKNLVPTDKGEIIIGLVPDLLTRVDLTAGWEEKLTNIANGTDQAPEFDKGIRDLTSTVVEFAKSQPVSQIGGQAVREGDGGLGACPLCGAPVREFPKSYSCTAYRSTGCRFTIWKTIAGKTITPTQAKTLLTKKKTGVLKGFQSRAGNPFEAALEIDEQGKVRFVFANQKPEQAPA